MNSLVHDAQKWWGATFNDTPYTNFFQIEYLVKTAGASWQDILIDPKILAKRVGKDAIANDKSPLFNHTWASAGRCTSFAVRVARQLQEHLEKPNGEPFDFKFYDLKRHRVARCAKTGVLIDSSSSVGILVLKEGEWATIDGEQMKWKWIAGKSKFERGGTMVSNASLLNPDSPIRC
jgi:hypothetical protein